MKRLQRGNAELPLIMIGMMLMLLIVMVVVKCTATMDAKEANSRKAYCNDQGYGFVLETDTRKRVISVSCVDLNGNKLESKWKEQ